MHIYINTTPLRVNKWTITFARIGRGNLEIESLPTFPSPSKIRKFPRLFSFEPKWVYIVLLTRKNKIIIEITIHIGDTYLPILLDNIDGEKQANTNGAKGADEENDREEEDDADCDSVEEAESDCPPLMGGYLFDLRIIFSF